MKLTYLGTACIFLFSSSAFFITGCSETGRTEFDAGVDGLCTGRTCRQSCIGPNCVPVSPFSLPGEDENVQSSGVERNLSGEIILRASGPSGDSNVVWVSNSINWTAGTVSKISSKAFDTAPLYREVARYPTVTCQSDTVKGNKEGAVFGKTPPATLCANGVDGCCAGSEGRTAANGKHPPINLKSNKPAQTAVDTNGDVWVANPSWPQSVTKIANDIKDCIERNGRTGIQTSSDANNDGKINTDCNGDNQADDINTICPVEKPQEFFGLDDECVLFTTDVRAEAGVSGHAMAISLAQGATPEGASDVWAGVWADGMRYKIDGGNGKVIRTLAPPVNVPDFPYPEGSAIDQFGIIWVRSAGRVFYFDSAQPENFAYLNVPAGVDAYGIAVDGYTENGRPVQQVWLGNHNGVAARYRPPRTGRFQDLGSGTWATVSFDDVDPKIQKGQGVAIDGRLPTSYAWVALEGAIARVPTDIPDGENHLLAYNDADRAHNLVIPLDAITQIGVGVGTDGDIWAVADAPAIVTHLKIDGTGGLIDTNKIDLSDDFGFFLTPYSDFTGFGLRHFTIPKGTYSTILEGCPYGGWRSIAWSSDLPPGTQISVRWRAANAKRNLDEVNWSTNATTSPLQVVDPVNPSQPPTTRFLQMEFTLSSATSITPVLRDIHVTYSCEEAGPM